MSKLIPIIVFLLAGFAAFTDRAAAAVVYRAGEGWSTEGEEGQTIEKTATAQFTKAQDFENQGQTKQALNAYRGLVRKFQFSNVAPKAQLKIGLLSEQLGDYDSAFKAYGKYLSKYPRGEDFDKAVEGQFNIAKRFLEGERKRLFGVKTFSSMARAQEMFESIIKNAPFSKFAPLAQFNIGLALEKQGKYPEAINAYQTVITRYPSDPIAADAQYQIGYVHLKESRQGTVDNATSNKSREAFEDFLARYPTSEKVPQAKDNLSTINSRQTKGVYDIGKFYDKQKNYKAAVIYYNEVIKQQPGSPDSEAAKKRIDELKNLVGEDALRAGPERAETGRKASERRKLQAQVDTAKRSDYLGPPVEVPAEVPAEKPKLRTSPEDVAPVPAVEPALPQQ